MIHTQKINIFRRRISAAGPEDKRGDDKGGMEMLLVMDPANMNYLTGCDAAFYAGNLA